MRMDQRQTQTASDIVNGYEERELYRIIRDYGEDKFAKNIAKHIVAARQQAPITTTGQLYTDHTGIYPYEDTGSRRTSCQAYLPGNPY